MQNFAALTKALFSIHLFCQIGNVLSENDKQGVDKFLQDIEAARQDLDWIEDLTHQCHFSKREMSDKYNRMTEHPSDFSLPLEGFVQHIWDIDPKWSNPVYGQKGLGQFTNRAHGLKVPEEYEIPSIYYNLVNTNHHREPVLYQSPYKRSSVTRKGSRIQPTLYRQGNTRIYQQNMPFISQPRNNKRKIRYPEGYRKLNMAIPQRLNAIKNYGYQYRKNPMYRERRNVIVDQTTGLLREDVQDILKGYWSHGSNVTQYPLLEKINSGTYSLNDKQSITANKKGNLENQRKNNAANVQIEIKAHKNMTKNANMKSEIDEKVETVQRKRDIGNSKTKQNNVSKEEENNHLNNHNDHVEDQKEKLTQPVNTLDNILSSTNTHSTENENSKNVEMKTSNQLKIRRQTLNSSTSVQKEEVKNGKNIIDVEKCDSQVDPKVTTTSGSKAKYKDNITSTGNESNAQDSKFKANSQHYNPDSSRLKRELLISAEKQHSRTKEMKSKRNKANRNRNRNSEAQDRTLDESKNDAMDALDVMNLVKGMLTEIRHRKGERKYFRYRDRRSHRNRRLLSEESEKLEDKTDQNKDANSISPLDKDSQQHSDIETEANLKKDHHQEDNSAIKKEKGEKSEVRIKHCESTNNNNNGTLEVLQNIKSSNINVNEKASLGTPTSKLDKSQKIKNSESIDQLTEKGSEKINSEMEHKDNVNRIADLKDNNDKIQGNLKVKRNTAHVEDARQDVNNYVSDSLPQGGISANPDLAVIKPGSQPVSIEKRDDQDSEYERSNALQPANTQCRGQRVNTIANIIPADANSKLNPGESGKDYHIQKSTGQFRNQNNWNREARNYENISLQTSHAKDTIGSFSGHSNFTATNIQPNNQFPLHINNNNNMVIPAQHHNANNKDHIDPAHEKRSPLKCNSDINSSKHIDKALKTSPSDYRDDSQMASTVTGNLASQVVDKTLQKVNSTQNLKYYFAGGLSQNVQNIFKDGCSDDLYRLEEDDYQTRTEKTLKQICRLIQQLVSEEVKMKSCKVLQPELHDFLRWMLVTDEDSSEEKPYADKDNFLFRQIESKEEDISTIKPSKQPPKCSKTYKNRTVNPEQLQHGMEVLHDLLLEYNHLTDDEKDKVQPEYQKLTKDLEQLQNFASQMPKNMEGEEFSLDVNGMNNYRYAPEPETGVSLDKNSYGDLTTSQFNKESVSLGTKTGARRPNYWDSSTSGIYGKDTVSLGTNNGKNNYWDSSKSGLYNKESVLPGTNTKSNNYWNPPVSGIFDKNTVSVGANTGKNRYWGSPMSGLYNTDGASLGTNIGANNWDSPTSGHYDKDAISLGTNTGVNNYWNSPTSQQYGKDYSSVPSSNYLYSGSQFSNEPPLNNYQYVLMPEDHIGMPFERETTMSPFVGSYQSIPDQGITYENEPKLDNKYQYVVLPEEQNTVNSPNENFQYYLVPENNVNSAVNEPEGLSATALELPEVRTYSADAPISDSNKKETFTQTDSFNEGNSKLVNNQLESLGLTPTTEQFDKVELSPNRYQTHELSLNQLEKLEPPHEEQQVLSADQLEKLTSTDGQHHEYSADQLENLGLAPTNDHPVSNEQPNEYSVNQFEKLGLPVQSSNQQPQEFSFHEKKRTPTEEKSDKFSVNQLKKPKLAPENEQSHGFRVNPNEDYQAHGEEQKLPKWEKKLKH